VQQGKKKKSLTPGAQEIGEEKKTFDSRVKQSSQGERRQIQQEREGKKRILLP